MSIADRPQAVFFAMPLHERFTWAAAATFGAEWPSMVAQELGVNVRTVQRWANGSNDIPANVWVQLATIVRVRARALQRLAPDLDTTGREAGAR